MKQCQECEGRGTYRTYVDGLVVCDDCDGTGVELTLEQREMVQSVLRAINARRVAGWGKP